MQSETEKITPEELATLKGNLTEYVNQITTRKGSAFVCPLCGSGTGTKGTPAFSIEPDGQRWKCFACNEAGDLLDLIGRVETLHTFPERAARAADLFNGKAGAPPKQPTATRPPAPPPHEPINFTPFIEATRQAITRTDYPQSRGLTRETINRFRLGYFDGSPEQRAILAQLIGRETLKEPSLIIPYNRENSYFIARPITPTGEAKYRKPPTEQAGPEPLYNVQALYNLERQPVFVVEGGFDAISVMQAGGMATGLMTTGHQRLLNQLKKRPTENPLIIALDNDEPGTKAGDKLEADFKAAGIKCTRYTIGAAKGYTDANEYLQADPEGLRQEVSAAIEEADQERAEAIAQAEQEQAEKEAQTEKERVEREAKYRQTSAKGRISAFVDGIGESRDVPLTPTGFKKLDEILDGGLYPGLYGIGAVSSLGKTSFILQVTDQIAKAGRDVLFFSLEMAASELMAKSISRLTYELCGGYPANAKTARGIADGKRYGTYSPEEIALIQRSIAGYEGYSDHIYFSEGIGNIGVAEVWTKVKEHQTFTGFTPVVVIDYLQLLAPYNERATDKQNTDKAVLELKRLSREEKTPVIVISSFNRASYHGPVTMEAFKESGAIEYSTDVLLGLQPAGLLTGSSDKVTTANKGVMHNCKNQIPRQVEVFVLKNRNGQTHKGAAFTYNPLFNHFNEGQEINTEAGDFEPY